MYSYGLEKVRIIILLSLRKSLNGCRSEEFIMSEILEIIMIVSFGASWPMNVMKSYKARTAKGKSLAFLLLIFFGYIAGIISKAVTNVK